MTALFEGIYTRYSDTSAESVALRATLTGGLHFLEPPQDNPFPYAVFFMPTAIPWDRFVEKGEDAEIQFNIFDKKSTTTVDPAKEICALFSLLDAVYNRTDLVVDGYTHVSSKRLISEALPPDEDGVYQYVVSYRILIEDSQ